MRDECKFHLGQGAAIRRGPQGIGCSTGWKPAEGIMRRRPEITPRRETDEEGEEDAEGEYVRDSDAEADEAFEEEAAQADVESEARGREQRGCVADGIGGPSSWEFMARWAQKVHLPWRWEPFSLFRRRVAGHLDRQPVAPLAQGDPRGAALGGVLPFACPRLPTWNITPC